MQDEVISLLLTCCDWFESLSTTITWCWEGLGGRDVLKLLFYIWWLTWASRLSSLCKHSYWNCVWVCYVLLHTYRTHPQSWAENGGVQHSIPWIRLKPIFSQFGKLMNFTHANVSARGLAQLKDTPQLTSVFLQKKRNPRWRSPHRLNQLTPFKGGLRVQLANKINRMRLKCCR